MEMVFVIHHKQQEAFWGLAGWCNITHQLGRGEQVDDKLLREASPVC